MELLIAVCMGRNSGKKGLQLVSSIRLSCPWLHKRGTVPKALRIKFMAEDSVWFSRKSAVGSELTLFYISPLGEK